MTFNPNTMFGPMPPPAPTIDDMMRPLFPNASAEEIQAAMALMGGGFSPEIPGIPAGPPGPAGPTDPFESLALAGGLPPAPPISSGLGISPLTQLAQGLVRGATSFLGVPIAKGGQRLQQRQADRENAAALARELAREKRADVRAAKSVMFQRAMRQLGEDALGDNATALYEFGQEYGRDATRSIGRAIRVKESDVFEEFLSEIPEQGSAERKASEPTTRVLVRGYPVDVPQSEMPGFLQSVGHLLPDPSVGGGGGLGDPPPGASDVLQPNQVRTTISSIVDDAHAQAMDELGFGSYNMTAPEEDEARLQLPILRRKKTVEAINGMIRAGLLTPVALGYVDAALVQLALGDSTAVAPADTSGTGAGAVPPSGESKRTLTRQEIKDVVASFRSRAEAFVELRRNRGRLSPRSIKELERAIQQKFGRDKRISGRRSGSRG